MIFIPNILAAMIFLSISYGCMVYIPIFPDNLSNSRTMIRKNPAQQTISNLENQITKTNSLLQNGFKNNTLIDKKGKDISKLTKTKIPKQQVSKKKSQKDKKSKVKGIRKGKGKGNRKGKGKGKRKGKGNRKGKGKRKGK